jgi:hypothetical protein
MSDLTNNHEKQFSIKIALDQAGKAFFDTTTRFAGVTY